MGKKVLWIALSFILVAALVLGSCQAAAPEEKKEGETVTGKVTEKEAPTVKEEEKKGEEPAAAPGPEEPRYGGTLTVLHGHATLEPASWDPADCNWITEPFTSPYMEKLVRGDFEAKGRGGTGEFPFTDWEFIPPDHLTGCLAESWELVDDTTVIYHIREGVYWQNRPGVMSAREFTAEDVAYAKTRLIESPKCPGYYDNVESVTALDKYTVQVKLKQYDANWMLPLSWGYFQRIYAREAVEAGISDWRNACGTGPFILKDYVSGASLTFERNPDYWGTTTINGKEYEVPFVDRMIWPIMPDASTQLAALRTGKVDMDESMGWEDAETIMVEKPELTHYRSLSTTGPVIACRYDVEPFDDERIRWALNMAIDREAIIDSLHGGNAVMLGFPYSPDWGPDFYTPLEELSEDAQALFTYDPARARELMAEAGYPDGFKGEVVCTSGWSDTVALLADYWSEINVELEQNVVEYGVYYAIMRGKTHKHMYAMSKGCGDPFAVLQVIGIPGQYWNPSMFDDPYYTETYEAAEAEPDVEKAKQMLKSLNAYIIEQAPYVILPVSYFYQFSWPWVKNWHGEINATTRSPGPIHARIWLDTALKKSMGYR